MTTNQLISLGLVCLSCNSTVEPDYVNQDAEDCFFIKTPDSIYGDLQSLFDKQFNPEVQEDTDSDCKGCAKDTFKRNFMNKTDPKKYAV